MATQSQIKASRQNALKHGLLARDTVLPGEDPAEFGRQLTALEADIRPANSLEFEIVRRIADARYQMRRVAAPGNSPLAPEGTAYLRARHSRINNFRAATPLWRTVSGWNLSLRGRVSSRPAARKPVSRRAGSQWRGSV